MQQLFKHSFLDFKQSYEKYLSFELIYSLLASILFAPFLTYVFNSLLIMFRKGPALINNDVLSFGFSYKGIIALLIVGLLAIAILFVEFGVIIVIAHKSYHRNSVYLSQAAKTVFMKIPKLLGLGFFQVFFLMFLFLPWVDVATIPMFLDINKTIIFMNLFNDSLMVKIVYLFIFIILVYLFIRWIFSLQFIFLQDKSIWQAMKSSWRMTKKRQAILISYLVVLNVAIFAIGIAIITFVSFIAGFIDSQTVGHFIGEYLVTFSSYFALVISLFLVPLNIIILTRLFYKFMLKSGEEIEDELVLKDSRILLRIEKKLTAFFKNRKTIVRSVIVILLSLMFLVNYTTSDAVVYLPWDVDVVAHRGDGFRSPENSLSGIKSSIETGIDAVEIDVTLTKDRVVVLSHDKDLQRIAGEPDLIEDLMYDELMEIDIGRIFDESFTGERVPTLAEALEHITETETKVIIDVKVDNDEAEEYAQKIVELINVYDAADLSLVQSFNNQFLQGVRKENPDIDIGQILFLSVGNISKLDVDFYTIRQTMLTERLIKEAHKENRDVWVWTVNDVQNIKEVLKYDVDGIITDYPERVYQLIETK